VSQFETLEPLDADERGITISVDQAIDAIIDEFVVRCPHAVNTTETPTRTVEQENR
jgi:gluconokinase